MKCDKMKMAERQQRLAGILKAKKLLAELSQISNNEEVKKDIQKTISELTSYYEIDLQKVNEIVEKRLLLKEERKQNKQQKKLEGQTVE